FVTSRTPLPDPVNPNFPHIPLLSYLAVGAQPLPLAHRLEITIMESMASSKGRKKPSQNAALRHSAETALSTLERPVATESFYRDLVWNLRNGVVAVTIDGRIA